MIAYTDGQTARPFWSAFDGDFWAANAPELLWMTSGYCVAVTLMVFGWMHSPLTPSDTKYPRDFAYLILFWPICTVVLGLAVYRCFAEDTNILVHNTSVPDHTAETSEIIKPFQMSDFEWRWFYTTCAGLQAMALYAGASLYTTSCCLWDGPLKNLPMFLHHALSFYSMALAVCTGRCGYWGSLALLCETTNQFLNFVCLTKVQAKTTGVTCSKKLHNCVDTNAKTDSGKTLVCTARSDKEDLLSDQTETYGLEEKAKKTYCRLSQHISNEYPLLCLVNGFLLMISFIPFRLVLFPWWLYQYFVDIFWYLPECRRLLEVRVSNDIRQLQCRRDTNLWDKYQTSLEVGSHSSVLVLIFILSAYWFPTIVKGFGNEYKSYKAKIAMQELKKKE